MCLDLTRNRIGYHDLAPSICGVGEGAEQQRDVVMLRGVRVSECDLCCQERCENQSSDPHFDNRVERGYICRLKVWPGVKDHLVDTGGKRNIAWEEL